MMKKVSIGLAIALSVVACKKKKDSENKEPVGSSAPMVQETGSGSAGAMMAGSGSAAAEATLNGKDLADKYMKCVGLINDGKLDDFASTCVAADYKGHDMDEGDMSGVDALKTQFTAMRKAFPDFHLTPQLVIINGRNILAVNMVTGTNSGAMEMPGAPAMPATNKKFGQLMFHRLTLNDQNKATEEWAYADPATMMGQLGMAPKGMPVRPMMDKGWDGAPNVVVTADNDTEKKNLEVVKAMSEAFNARKTPEMLAMMSDDFVESDQAGDKDNKGKKEAEAGIKMFQTAFSDGKVTVDNTFAGGDYVVLLGTFTGTNDHDAGPMKKTGKKVTLHMAEVMKLKDGKVTNLWRFRNGMAMAMQLGLMPPMGAGGGSAAGSAAAGSAAPKK
jgi:predicted ester cyclase